MSRDVVPGFLGGEDGQATVEYMLVLAISVSLALMIIKRLLKPITEKMAASLNRMIDKGFNQGVHNASFVRRLMGN